jgi:NAD(P)-dependent dehydrogenase (short-subunit alcohol dehydrogenase family)
MVEPGFGAAKGDKRMSKTIAIVGAGPGVGMGVAQAFGRRGFNVALIARTPDKIHGLTEGLRGQGIEAAAFQADIRDREGLALALAHVKDRYGAIEVLEFGPSGVGGVMKSPRLIDVENAQQHLELNVLGAVAAVQAVLPDMLARKSGSLLFTTAPSAQRPLVVTASYGLAAGALINYVRLLHKDLKDEGIYAGAVAIAAFVTPVGQAPDPARAAFPTVAAEEVGELHFQLHEARGDCEATIGDVERLYAVPGFR